MKPIIAILEDQIERIEWITENHGEEADIRWSNTVEGFFDILRSVDKENLAMIILDHDLGAIPRTPGTPGGGSSLKASGHWPHDEHGKNGTYAVSKLDGWSDIPTIVWSVNNIAGPRMVKDLKSKGFNTGWIPFIDSQHHLISINIKNIVSKSNDVK